MDLLPVETWNLILSLLEKNSDRFHLLITFRDMFKCSVSFDEMIDLDKIRMSQWFDDFSNIQTNNITRSLPKKIKYFQINFISPATTSSWIDCSISLDYYNIPEGITDLTFNIKNYETLWEDGIIPTTCQMTSLKKYRKTKAELSVFRYFLWPPGNKS